MTERLKVVPELFTAVVSGSRVLMLRRKDTGWLDGYYDLPSGHLEPGESLQKGAARELEEETGLVIDSDKLNLVHLYQNDHNPDQPYMGLIFKINEWQGTPRIREPTKCDDISWFSLDELPERTVPYVVHALGSIASTEVSFAYWGRGSMNGA